MKKIISLFVIVIGALCTSVLYAAYTPMTAYTRTANTTVDLSATTGFTDFKLRGTLDTIVSGHSSSENIKHFSSTVEPQKLVNNENTFETFPVGFDFPYGAEEFSRFALTGDGTVFLGKAGTLVTRWALNGNNSYITNTLNATIRVNTAKTYSGYNFSAAPVICIDASSSVGYKTDNDKLYIRFKEILLKTDTISERATYTIILAKDGSVAINLEKMPTVKWGAYNPAFGLNVSLKSMGLNDRICLKGWSDLAFSNNVSTYTGADNFPMSSDSFTANTQLNIERPAGCAAPVDASVIAAWGAQTILPTEFTGAVNIQGADGAFVVFSTDGNLNAAAPTNGKYYFPAMVGEKNPNTGVINSADSFMGYPVIASNKLANMANGTLTLNQGGLTASTDYYVYLFPYNDKCVEGPLYGNMKKIQFKTAAPPPTVTAANIGSDSITLKLENLPASDSVLIGIAATNYYVAGSAWIPADIEKDTLIYIEGQEESGGGFWVIPAQASKFVKKQYLGTITGGKYVIDGLNEGQAYYIYVWSKNGGELSATYSQARIRTISSTPIAFNYATDDVNAGLPVAGWEISPTADVSIVSTGGGAGGRSLSSVTPDLVNNDYEKAIKLSYDALGASKTAASPYFTTNMVDNKITTTIRITSENNNTGMENNIASIAAGDTLSVWYKKISDAEWTFAGTHSAGTVLAYNNNYATIETPLTLTVGDTFQIRYYLCFKGNMMNTKNVYIKNTEITPEYPCKYAQNITVNDILTTNTIIALDWEDINSGAGADFIYAVREKGESEWGAFVTAERGDGLTATGLKTHTPYELAIRAVCSAGDSSAIRIMEASTLYGAPYKQNFTKLATLPADYRKAGSPLIQQGKPTFNMNETSSNWWQNEPIGDSLLGINGSGNNSWLLFPVIYLNDAPGDVTLDFSAKAFYRSGGNRLPVFDTCKTMLYVVAASTIDSLNGNHIIDTINITSLTTDWSRLSVDLSAFTKRTQLAFFLVADVNSAARNVYLQIDSIDIDYRSTTVECLGVSDIRTSDLTATGVTVSWNGTALEYGIFYKDAESSDEETIEYTAETSITLTGLNPGITYSYYIEPYCGENHTIPGPVMEEDYFTTLEATSIKAAVSASKDFVVSSNAGRISILNPSAVKIDRVEVVAMNGAVLQQKNVKTSSNILLSEIKVPQVVVVRIASDNNEYTYKILAK